MKLTIKAQTKTRYFFDTEFNEDGKTIDLISIGIVSEDGREYYAISNEFNLEACNDWVKENVIPHLSEKDTWKSRKQIKEEILEFVTGEPEFWANHASYDWVVFCQLFGTMMDLPKGFPMYVQDVKLLELSKGISSSDKLPFKQEGTEHNALEDARFNLKVYNYLAKTED